MRARRHVTRSATPSVENGAEGCAWRGYQLFTVSSSTDHRQILGLIADQRDRGERFLVSDGGSVECGGRELCGRETELVAVGGVFAASACPWCRAPARCLSPTAAGVLDHLRTGMRPIESVDRRRHGMIRRTVSRGILAPAQSGTATRRLPKEPNAMGEPLR